MSNTPSSPTHVVSECLDCGHREPFSPLQATCPKCGSEWRTARYDYDRLASYLPAALPQRPFDLWRYHELLPVAQPRPEISMGEGGTPLLRLGKLGMMLKLPHLYFKDERQSPTSSFKDRQAAVTIAVLKEAGITEMVVASTGNVAIAYAAYAARAGIKLWAFLTSLVPAEKMREVAIYGAQVIKVTGTYDQTKQVAAEFARQRGLYLDNGARSLPTVEAMKTLAYEISEQLTERLGAPGNGFPWRTPTWFVQSVSGALGPLGVFKAYEELQWMGFVESPPKMALIQSEGCAPMAQAWKQDRRVAEPVRLPRTHIATLATGDPGRVYTMLYDSMKTHGGTFTSVSDEEAFRAMHILAKMEGLSVEPATAVAVAGVIQLARQGVIQPDDVVVINGTGHTMPIESHILGNRWIRKVDLSAQSKGEGEAEEPPADGLRSALSTLAAREVPHIAIVDDHEPARILLRRVLQSLGEFTISEASDGEEAIALARREHPDLILLDLMMPKTDGFQVIETLRSDPHTADIPIIAVTAKTLTPEEERRLSGQIEKLMLKGDFLTDELLDEIRALLG
ncbi:MAG: pyridoxal-phosphate dependent enzyme [Chloroflexi bacterium]|nr:pyridoxal-phosphate dependent enzyme [Chloroflexota bacterium]